MMYFGPLYLKSTVARSSGGYRIIRKALPK